MSRYISGTQAYNYLLCPHRVALDAHEDPQMRDETNPFTEMLWDHGVAHEARVAAGLNITVNLAGLPADEREFLTRDAMDRGEPLIYQARLVVGDRVGEPDLLERHENGYRAGDVKLGSGFDGDEELGKLKKTYAVQTAHYTSLLDELELSDRSGTAFIIDGASCRVDYPLHAPQGVRNTTTWMQLYESVLDDLRPIVRGTKRTKAALGATCKLCHWASCCKRAVVAADDLSLIAELGRSKRDTLSRLIPTVSALATADVSQYVAGKKTVFPGIGPDTLRKYQARAVLLTTPNARPYLKQPVDLPVVAKEAYLDIEADPMRENFVYLHGLVEREHGQPATARFMPALTPDVTPEAEEEAFRQIVQYLTARVLAGDTAIYYYSPYERVAYKVLAQRYPSVISVETVEDLFAQPLVIDLYTDVVRKATEWPTYDQSIKTLAKFLGFQWRDPNPSGAASIQWFDEWVQTRDPAKIQRVLDYNEDDCLATGVVVDGIRQLPLHQQP